ncbi:MAG: GNAT family N-acetyltransferase [Simkaniaceae bacterium]|nr:GNAT family N-acetyltransferase [Simkaniaceae bacterium]MCF7851649.1 GNAT family N-acetyltransferase [Simkaniaceae bacterium]
MGDRLTDSSDYNIRYTRLLDKSSLIGWMSHPEVVKWFPVEQDKEKDLFLRNWIGFSKFGCSLTATYQHKPVGIATLYLMPYKKVAHLAMFNIVVDPYLQGKGIGTSLVRNIAHLAKTQFKLYSIHAEIMEGCLLIPVLQKQGFNEVFRQEDYFKLNDEYYSRIVMEVVF